MQKIYSGRRSPATSARSASSCRRADESIKVAFGVENPPRQSDERDRRSALPQDLLSGAGGATIGLRARPTCTTSSPKLRVPLVQDKTFAEQLSLDTRVSLLRLRSGITTDTYKFGVDWAPVEDVRFRGSYQRAVRAPNIVELFTAQGFNLFDLPGDPCGADQSSAAADAVSRAARCLAAGVPDDQFAGRVWTARLASTTSCRAATRRCKPETSDTYTYGVIFSRGSLPHLAMSIDYFDIKIDDTISTFGADNTLDACYGSDDRRRPADAILPQPGNGSLWHGNGNVVDLNTNIGALETKGVDLSLSYTGLDVGGWGELSFNLVGTYLDEMITCPGAEGFPTFDCTGKFSGTACSLTTAVNPELRITSAWAGRRRGTSTCRSPARYFSAVIAGRRAAQHRPSSAARELLRPRSAAGPMTEKASVRLGINNVLDKDPPITRPWVLRVTATRSRRSTTPWAAASSWADHEAVRRQ